MTKPAEPQTSTTPPNPLAERSRIPRWVRIGGIAAVVASSTLWLGAIVYGAVGDFHPIGYLTDRTFPTKAEPICKAARDDLEKFPPAPASKTPADRATVIEGTTARLQTMLDDLRKVVPKGSDAKWITLWIDDWEIHLHDRLDFATRLREKGAKEEFFESAKAGEQISKSLDHYAEVNKMESCATPGDV